MFDRIDVVESFRLHTTLKLQFLNDSNFYSKLNGGN